MLKLTSSRLTHELRGRDHSQQRPPSQSQGQSQSLQPAQTPRPSESEPAPEEQQCRDAIQDSERVELVRQVWHLKDQLSARFSIPMSDSPTDRSSMRLASFDRDRDAAASSLSLGAGSQATTHDAVNAKIQMFEQQHAQGQAPTATRGARASSC
eukprot:198421-Rhodomonas_salina.2